jgi:hypothetical protein
MKNSIEIIYNKAGEMVSTKKATKGWNIETWPCLIAKYQAAKMQNINNRCRKENSYLLNIDPSYYSNT